MPRPGQCCGSVNATEIMVEISRIMLPLLTIVEAPLAPILPKTLMGIGRSMMHEPANNHSLGPVFSVGAEFHAMEVLNVLIVVHAADASPIEAAQLTDLYAAVTRIVDCLFPIKGDSADFSGTDVLEGSDYTHPIKVAELAVVVGHSMGMPRSALIRLAMSAALMNIGYVALRRSLFDEPQRLRENEWEEHVHSHPHQGLALLARSGLPDECLRAIAQHHERWDGSGYPGGLRSDAIVRDARILAVADSYVSLRSLRPYRQAVGANEALREIVSNSGTLFDPQVVEAFEEIIARFTGSTRPEHAGAERAQASADALAEGHEAQRNGIGQADGLQDASRPVLDAEHDGESRESHTGARRSEVLAAQGATAYSDAGSAIGRVPAPSVSADAGSTPAATKPIRAVQPAAAPPPPPMRAGRRRAQRLWHRQGTLFSTRPYVDAAMRGAWTLG